MCMNIDEYARGQTSNMHEYEIGMMNLTIIKFRLFSPKDGQYYALPETSDLSGTFAKLLSNMEGPLSNIFLLKVFDLPEKKDSWI